MFLRTAVLLCVLALAHAVPMNPVRLAISPHINSSTESTWPCGDRVTVKWDTSMIPAEDNFPGMLVLGHLEGDSEYLDVDHPLAQDFPLRAGSVEFTVPDVNLVGNNYTVVLFGVSGDASPQFTIMSRSKSAKNAPRDALPDDFEPFETDPFPAGSNGPGALSLAQHIHHTGTIALCAAVAAMSIMFVM